MFTFEGFSPASTTEDGKDPPEEVPTFDTDPVKQIRKEIEECDAENRNDSPLTFDDSMSSLETQETREVTTTSVEDTEVLDPRSRVKELRDRIEEYSTGVTEPKTRSLGRAKMGSILVASPQYTRNPASYYFGNSDFGAAEVPFDEDPISPRTPRKLQKRHIPEQSSPPLKPIAMVKTSPAQGIKGSISNSDSEKKLALATCAKSTTYPTKSMDTEDKTMLTEDTSYATDNILDEHHHTKTKLTPDMRVFNKDTATGDCQLDIGPSDEADDDDERISILQSFGTDEETKTTTQSSTTTAGLACEVVNPAREFFERLDFFRFP